MSTNKTISVKAASQGATETRGVSHCGLAIYIFKKYIKAKEELCKFKYFTMQKI
jgi:hypothetical protein